MFFDVCAEHFCSMAFRRAGGAISNTSCYTFSQDVSDDLVFDVDFTPVWRFMIKNTPKNRMLFMVLVLCTCVVGSWQWPWRGIRVGEASNPGPPVMTREEASRLGPLGVDPDDATQMTDGACPLRWKSILALRWNF